MIQFFSIILGFVIPNSFNHCTCQRIFIMYSYICIKFYFCMRQDLSVTPSKLPVFPPTINQPREVVSCCRCWSYQEKASCCCHWSVHPCPLEVALSYCHQSYWEKALCCCCWSVRLHMLVCRRNRRPAKRQSVMSLPLIWTIILRKSIVLPPLISPPAPADSLLHITSRTVNQLREVASCLCRQSVHPRLLIGRCT